MIDTDASSDTAADAAQDTAQKAVRDSAQKATGIKGPEPASADARKKRRRWWRALWALPVVLLVVAVGFVAWASMAAAPMPRALAALQSSQSVTVSTQPWLAFEPSSAPPKAGLIVYPGARVDPRAYAPVANKIAQEGYLVVIVPMPLNLAFFGANRADDVIAAYPDVEKWAVAGHSLGGVAAASYARDHPDRVDGLVLWASYPQEADNLSSSNLEVTSISGKRDGLSTPAEIEASRKLLPPGTTWVAIDGGNHAQFGSYGPQNGDNTATISREEQQAMIAAATEDLLARLP